GFSLARFLGEEITDRFLFERLRRGGADVDLLRVGARVAQQLRRHQVVVEDHVRRGEALHPAHRNQPRVSRPCANQVNGGHVYGWIPPTAPCSRLASARISAPPSASSCSPSCRPSADAVPRAPFNRPCTASLPSSATTMPAISSVSPSSVANAPTGV